MVNDEYTQQTDAVVTRPHTKQCRAGYKRSHRSGPHGLHVLDFLPARTPLSRSGGRVDRLLGTRVFEVPSSKVARICFGVSRVDGIRRLGTLLIAH